MEPPPAADAVGDVVVGELLVGDGVHKGYEVELAKLHDTTKHKA